MFQTASSQRLFSMEFKPLESAGRHQSDFDKNINAYETTIQRKTQKGRGLAE